MSHDALDLGVTRLAHDDDLVACGAQALSGNVDLLDVGTGRVKHGETALARFVLDGRSHAMGTDDDGAGRDVLKAIRHLNTGLLELVHHAGVVDERAQGVNGRQCIRAGAMRELERALDAVAHAGVPGDLYARGHGYFLPGCSACRASRSS